MTTQETISLVSTVIAAIGLVTTAVLSITLYRRKKHDDEEANRRRKRDDEDADRLKQREVELASLVGYLQPLLNELERTNLFDVSPEDEIWEFGFSTLGRLAELCASAYIATDISRFAGQKLRAAISRLHHDVKGLRAYQDSWRIFSKDKESGDWRALQREWPDIRSATAALQAARPIAKECKGALSQFLRNHGSPA